MILILSLVFVVALSACQKTTTTTNGDDHVYSLNEEIEIIDSNTKGIPGHLKVTGVDVILDELFTLSNPEIEYQKLVRIEYEISLIDSSRTRSLFPYNSKEQSVEYYTYSQLCDFQFSNGFNPAALEQNSDENTKVFYVALDEDDGDFIKLEYWNIGIIHFSMVQPPLLKLSCKCKIFEKFSKRS